MHQALARVRVLQVAAATAAFSLAAVVTPTGLVPNLEAAVPGSPKLESQPSPAKIAAADAAVTVIAKTTLGPAKRHKPEKSYLDVASLPAYGTAEALKVTAPHVPTQPLLVFAPRLQPPLQASEVLYSAIVPPPVQATPGKTVLARLPARKPAVRERGTEATTLLAYAEAPSGLDAPFDAVMGGTRQADAADDDLYRPRPRPDPDTVLTWLDGRALGQFAPGQHPWVQNPLPQSVFEPKQQKCLAEAVYFESRGEPELGQAAVAQVVLNRVRNPAYPDTICGVVFQNQKWRNHCQFSFACDGRPESVTEKGPWAEAQRIASDVTTGKTWIDEVGDSTHYHAGYVRPRWGRLMIKVDKLGQHIFYRTKKGGWS